MGIFLSTLLVVSLVANSIIEAFFVETLKGKHPVGCIKFISLTDGNTDIPPPRSLVPSGCYPLTRSHLYNINYVIVLVFYGGELKYARTHIIPH